MTLPPNAPAPGHARIVLDAIDGPMRVVAEYDPSFVPPGAPQVSTQSGELCITPCVADLPVGRYRLYLSATEYTDASRGDSDDIRVGQGLYVYRRAPGRYDTPSPTDEILPATALLLSGVAIVAGSIALSAEAGDDKSMLPGGSLLAVGIGGAIGSGIWMYDASRAVTQQGATSFWQAGP